jgi:protein KRI1
MLNRGWIDRSARRLPTYAEVTDVKKRKKHKGEAKVVTEDGVSQEENVQTAEGDAELDAEDAFDDLAENFEASYNFRFEEP